MKSYIKVSNHFLHTPPPPLTVVHKYWKGAQNPLILIWTGMGRCINALISKIKTPQDLWVKVCSPT